MCATQPPIQHNEALILVSSLCQHMKSWMMICRFSLSNYQNKIALYSYTAEQMDIGSVQFSQSSAHGMGRACAEWRLIANNFQKYVCNSLVWPCWYSPTMIPVAYSLDGLGSNFLLGLENSSPHTPHLPWFTSLCCTCHYKEVENWVWNTKETLISKTYVNGISHYCLFRIVWIGKASPFPTMSAKTRVINYGYLRPPKINH